MFRHREGSQSKGFLCLALASLTRLKTGPRLFAVDAKSYPTAVHYAAHVMLYNNRACVSYGPIDPY